MNKTPLAPTAALVLRMGMPIYQAPLTKDYLSRVDMSSGDAMYKKFTTHIHLVNRKFFIRKLLLDLLAKSPVPFQWVVIAAGVDPMPLEILSIVPEKIAHVFELDEAFMDEKKKLYKEVAPRLAGKISCITTDITSPHFMEELMIKYAYDPVVPTFLQMEGITYYITENVIQMILGEFTSPNKQNCLFADFLLPPSSLSEAGRRQSEQIFGTIRRDTGYATTAPYTIDDFRRFLSNVGGRVTDHKTTYDLEILRTGSHAETLTPQDGIIDIVLGKL